MGKNHYENPDAVRNVIKSHKTMLVSLPREIAMRAGLQRGVQVRVDQDPKNPRIITMEVVNPANLGKELKEFLKDKKKAADNRVAREKGKANHAKKLAASAKKKEDKAKAKAKAKEDARKERAAEYRKTEKAARAKAEEKAAKEPASAPKIIRTVADEKAAAQARAEARAEKNAKAAAEPEKPEK